MVWIEGNIINKTKHYLLKAGIFSIILETISSLIYDENAEKLNPIQNKFLSKNIRQELIKTLNNFKEDISEEALKIFTSKINEINKPTNSKKLSFPFQYYNISLSKKELEILNHRNKFLHGTSPFDEKELDLKKYELLEIIAHMKFMINSLMLKYIGYSGNIINNPAFLELNSKEVLNSHLFKII